MKFLLSPYVLAYIAGVVLVNILFSFVPMIATPIGLVSPVAALVGIIFVLRDFAQRHVGHSVLFAMAIATVLSYLLADPYVATASAAAFIASEIIDYLVYTITKARGGSFRTRVLWSSVVSTPVDTAVFLLGIGAFTGGTFGLMIAAKMIAAIGLWVYYGPNANWHAETIDDLDDMQNPYLHRPY